ncbi:mediator complex, subunit Med18 [Cryomyces antarcticus]
MHELSIFGQVPAARHEQVLNILAGVAAMQPQRVLELHVVYAPSRSRIDRNAPVKGGTQDIAQKKKSAQAAGDVFYQQLVRDVREQEFGRVSSFAFELESKLGETVTEPGLSDSQPSQKPWTLQFYDVPEPGKRTVVSRVYSITEITRGDAHRFAKGLQYRYVTKYMLEGQRLVCKNIVILLHRILRFPAEHDTDEAMNTQLPTYTSMRPLDEAESYVLQASVRILDGSKPENLATGTEELLAFKELMKGAVDLSVVDRLSLDTRVKV